MNDAVRGPGSFDTAMRAMQNLADAGFRGFKLSVVMTRQNIPQIDEFKAIADRLGAAAADQAPSVRARRGRVGRTTRCPSSSASCTTGSSPTASRC